MQQEQWINEVMNSLDGLEKSKGNPFLHTRVMSKLAIQDSKKISFKPLYALASLVIFIMMLNVFLWNQPDTGAVDNNSVSSAMTEYDLTTIDY